MPTATPIEKFEVGQEYFQAQVLVNGGEIDCDCSCFTNRDDAQADGDIQAEGYNPTWQVGNPGCVSAVVRKYRVTRVTDDGDFAAESID